jgi:predicted nucleic acid-binding protein
MNKVIVVSDTSAISNLIQIDQLSLLIKLFPEIVVPPTVYMEVMQLSKFDIPVDQFINAHSEGQIKIHGIVDPLDELFELRSFLDEGEAEAIILAQEIKADWLLIDERLGRKAAAERGLSVIGLLGVLRLAKQENMVSYIKPLLNDLKTKAGFWFSDKLYQEVLQSVNE